MDDGDFEISEEIVKLQGILKANNTTTKDRVRKTALEKMRNYDR